MSHVTRLLGLIVVVVVVLVASQSVFTVRQNEQAILFRFGKIVTARNAPGLHFKWPFINQVKKFDSRILTLDNRPERFHTVGKRYLMVDFFVKWQIDDVGNFYNSTGGDEQLASERLADIIKNELRNEFSARTFEEVVASQRSELMDTVTRKANAQVQDFGVRIVDVRVKGIDLPQDVHKSVFDRMKSEQAQVASQKRAEGEQAATQIKAEADRKKTEVLAEAYSKAQELRGEGDAAAAAIYARAYRKDPDFYAFYRSLEAYRNGFKGPHGVLVLDPNSEFFRYFRSPGKSAR